MFLAFCPQVPPLTSGRDVGNPQHRKALLGPDMYVDDDGRRQRKAGVLMATPFPETVPALHPEPRLYLPSPCLSTLRPYADVRPR